MRRSFVLLLTSAALLVTACGSDAERNLGVAKSAGSTSTSIATGDTAPSGLPDGSPPASGRKACDAESLTIQTAFPTLTTGGGAGLFVRIFNTGQSCWLDGHPGVSLRTAKGDWTTLRLRPSDAVATNGPPWTGVFDPSLVGVVVFGQQPDANGPAVRYSALRLLLPNGGGSLEHEIDVTFNSPELTVQAFEADSQDR